MYRAHDLRGGGTIAVKVLHPELDAASEERFYREGRILARLRHPHIAEFIDCDKTPHGYYIATAFIDGAPLDQWCGAAKRLMPVDVWRIGVQVAGAIMQAHAAGVIHRDVKASNIMWSGQDAKLVDFGLAKVTPEATLELKPPRHPTAVGIPLGTEGYRPPEAGDTIDARTDVFGLGRTLYRLLARRPATDWPQGLEDTPVPLQRVVLAAGDPEVERRPATMAELRERLVVAGAHVWPQRAADPTLRPALHVWPVPADKGPAPTPEPMCSEATSGDPCSATVTPQLFERRLELRLRLAETRNGQTWRAYHHVLDCEVIVKIGPRTDARPRASKICREATALHKLSHPAFVRIHDCDYCADGAWYLVEEYIPGATLAERLARGRLDALAAVETVAEIAEALSEAHSRGIIHGDVHPGNFILEQGTTPRVRVIDLSDCRLLDHFFAASDQRYAEAPPHRGDTGPNFGQPDWVAPEILRGIKHTRLSDVYSLGLILYSLVTGERNGGARVHKIIDAGPREALDDRLREVLLEAAPELAESELLEQIAEVLAPEPEQRTVTMAHFGQMLRSTAASIQELRAPSSVASRAAAPASPAAPSQAAAMQAASLPASPSPAPAFGPAVWWRLAGGGVIGAVLASLLSALTGPEAPPESSQRSEPARAEPTQIEAKNEPISLEATTSETTRVEPSPGPPSEPPQVGVDPVPVRSSRRAVKPGSEPVTRAVKAGMATAATVTTAEATTATLGALAALRACVGAPPVIAADVSITRGRGVVGSLNLEPVPIDASASSWQGCVRDELESVRYPVSDETSRVRLRLKLR